MGQVANSNCYSGFTIPHNVYFSDRHTFINTQENKEVMTQKEMFDRIQALQHYSDYIIEATAQDDDYIDALILNGFITGVGIDTLREEFRCVYLRQDGLIISD